jgi:hypothetical protein
MSERTNEAWLSSLRSKGAARELALQDLRAFIFRGVMGYLHSRSDLSRLDIKDLEQLAEEKARDPEFASDPWAIRNWFYTKTPYYDHEVGIYPVGALDSREILEGLPLE